MREIIATVAQTSFEQTGHLRKKYVSLVENWLSRPEIIILKGVRRCGKSTILRQVASRLKESAVYVNFDDYRLRSNLDITLLEEIVTLFPHARYFFFDEIQKIVGFESWLRTHYDIEKHKKFIVSGSNISLFSPSLGTVLTGRNITLEVFPLDFAEFLEFGGKEFDMYLEFGGFPEIVLETDVLKKRDLLTQYFNDILLRDIFDKYSIGSTQQFKALAQYILSNTGLKISANKLGKELAVDSKTAETYLSYLVDAYLIFEVPFFSYSAKTKYVAGRASKYYVIDNGLASALAARMNKGRLFETLIAQKLRRNNNAQLYYWSGKKEVDFVQNESAYQATITKTDNDALTELQKTFRTIKNTSIITLHNAEQFLTEEKSSRS